jgi:hypothetical protein
MVEPTSEPAAHEPPKAGIPTYLGLAALVLVIAAAIVIGLSAFVDLPSALVGIALLVGLAAVVVGLIVGFVQSRRNGVGFFRSIWRGIKTAGGVVTSLLASF